MNDFLLSRKLKPDVVIMLNLEVVGGLKRMNDLLLPIWSGNDTLSFRAEGDNRDSISVHHDILLVSVDKEGCDLWFPKLEGLVLVQRPWCLSRDIYHLHCVDIRMNRLVADDELLKVMDLASLHSNIHIGDVELILVFQEEVWVTRVILIKLDDENSELVLILVGNKVEAFVLVIIDNLLNITDFVSII